MDPGVVDGICLAGRQYCFIDVYGNVDPCLNFKAASDAAEASGSGASARMGNILERSFEDIWQQSKTAQTIRQASRQNFSRCSGCTGTCTPCMALKYEETGELVKPTPSVCLKTALGTGSRNLIAS